MVSTSPDTNRVTAAQKRGLVYASAVYAHWLRDDREIPAAVLDRVRAPVDAPRARHEATGVRS
jgi:hypothetical protein